MTRTVYPGGWYASALPDGRFAVLIKDSHITTDKGDIPLPPGGNVLFLQIDPFSRGTLFAGVGHHDDKTYEWDDTDWVTHEQSCGMSPVIFTRDRLNIAHCEPEWGSQGFGYVKPDGMTIVPAWQVYAWPQAGIWGYTDLGDGLFVGQGSPRGVRIWDGAALRAVNDDNPRFIRAYRQGDAVALAYWNEKADWEAVIVQTTMAELRACPLADDVPEFPAPAPPPVPPPIPVPPTPETPMTTPNHFDTVQRVYANGSFDLTTHDGAGQFTEACVIALHARDQRWGHLKKTGAQNQYNGHAVDAVLYLHDTPGQSQAVDIIASNAHPDAKIAWTVDIPRYSKTDWLKPEGSVPGPTPEPTPTPTPQPPTPQPPTPGGSHPILDANIRDFATAYEVYVVKGDETMQIARDWYTKSRGHAPAESDMRMGIWRLLIERERWGTPRVAFEDTWPGGGR